MPLAIFDLDNTLTDRTHAFGRWARSFCEEHGVDPAEGMSALSDADGDGRSNRDRFFAFVKERFGPAVAVEELGAAFLDAIVEYMTCFEGTVEALGRLRRAGWTIGIATNGGPRQIDKIASAGLVPLVDGWCVSFEIDSLKPDGRIFETVASRCNASLEGGWMVGDSADADILGGRRLGLTTAWVRRGRPWPIDDWRPDHVVASAAEAVDVMLDGPATRSLADEIP